MPGVFVSHAAADKDYVSYFVDQIIRLGCEVPKEKIFFSSGPDTGIPTGKNLNSYVQSAVVDASIVVTILTPTFQTRPYCVAELGAAWSRVGTLFPLLAPNMSRNELQGVLTGLLVRYSNDSEALDELHELLCESVGTSPGARTWNTYKAKWLASVHSLSEKLEVPRIIAAEEYDKAVQERQGAYDALVELQAEVDELKSKVELLKTAKDAAVVREILAPKDEIGAFKALVEESRALLDGVPNPVREAIFWHIRGEDMPWPNMHEDQYRFDQVESARIDGWLVEGFEETLAPNSEMGKVRKAIAEIERLREFLQPEDRTEMFGEWFESEFDEVPLDLRNRILWDKLFVK